MGSSEAAPAAASASSGGGALGGLAGDEALARFAGEAIGERAVGGKGRNFCGRQAGGSWVRGRECLSGGRGRDVTSHWGAPGSFYHSCAEVLSWAWVGRATFRPNVNRVSMK